MTAPMLGLLRPQIHRFQLGAFDVTTILDGAQARDSLKPPFCIDQTDEVIKAHARANLIPSDRFENSFTPTLVNTGEHLVLFDTGNGAMRRGSGAGNLRVLLTEAGYQPEDVDVVVFTHAHPDHIAGVMEGDDLAYPNARYVIGQVEFDEWKSGDKIPQQRQENRDMFLRLIVPLAENMTFLQPDDEVVPGVRAVQAFGHSLGHLAFMIESNSKTCLIWGDVTNHYVLSLQHPDWRVGFDDDREQATATRKRVLDMVATDQLLVVGHHMPFPGVGYVERVNGIYRWLPVSYQLRV